MGAFETLLFTHTGAALTAAAPAPGDSNVVRNFNTPGQGHLLTAWMNPNFATLVGNQVAEIKSPNLHDNFHGIHMEIPSLAFTPAWNQPQWMHNPPQPLVSQDTLTILYQGSAALPDALAIQVYYDNLPGVQWQSITETELIKRGKGIAGVVVTTPTVLGTGVWESGVAINSTYDTLKANTYYAILGGYVYPTANVGCPVAASLKSSDTGNLRIAIPGTSVLPWFTTEYFVHLDRTFGIQPDANGNGGVGFIPVINASNKGSLIAEIAAVAAGAIAYNAVWFFQELA